jgi:putative copper resistance protein D
VDEALIAVRAVQLASTAITAGVLIFSLVVAGPVFRAAAEPGIANVLSAWNCRIAWTGLALVALSGIAWLVLQTSAMSGRPLGEALADGLIWVVLSPTHFGAVSIVRGVILVLLVVSLILPWTRFRWFGAPMISVVLVATIAWTGHAAGTVGRTGPLHLAADALHLLAASAWIGGLIPLLLLLGEASRRNETNGQSIALHAAQRFSTLGIVSVGVLLATGLINSWILIGSLRGLVDTDYGQLVLLKVVLFAAMLSVAAVNRMRLTPRLGDPPGSLPQVEALRKLKRNIGIEIVIGLGVFAVVGVLGTLHPAIHLVPA